LYDEAVDQLDLVRKRIRDSVTSLIKAKFIERPVPEEEKPPAEPDEMILLIMIAAVIILLGILLYVFIRRAIRRRNLLSPMRWEPSMK
jgi:hypothetical protein